jgi:hypothetical protein
VERTITDEPETTALNWNMMLFVALFLVLVGLFLFSLLRRKAEERGGKNEPSGPWTGGVNPGEPDKSEGE